MLALHWICNTFSEEALNVELVIERDLEDVVIGSVWRSMVP